MKDFNLHVSHWFKIKVIDHQREVVESFLWSNLTFELRKKYDWFFKYRAALLQIKYPRLEVITQWGNEAAQGKTLEQVRRNKIRAKKSKITEYENKLKKIELNWSSLFPITDDPNYKKAIEKINRLKFELLSI